MRCMRVGRGAWCFLALVGFAWWLAAVQAQVGGGQGSQYALLVGVNRYENKKALQQPDLKYAEADASDLADVLRAGGYARENVVLLTTKNDADSPLCPRGVNVRRELKALAEKATAADSVLVFFAGYERQFGDSKDYFLCTTEANPADRTSLIALSEVYRELGPCKAGLRLVVIDACRIREAGQLELPAGVATFFSCSAKEMASEDEKLGHGCFTYALLEALRGGADANKDGQVTLTEFERFVPSRVTQLTRKLDGKQTPEVLGDTSRTLPVVTLPRR